MNKIAIIFCLIFSSTILSQVRGIVKDSKGEPLSFVGIYLENSITGTTTNDNGYYELKINKKGSYTIVFQFLGFKTQKKKVTINSFPYLLDVNMEEEHIFLEEISINSNENPAKRIIKKAIEKRKYNNDKLRQFTASFYSKGLYKIKNAPEKFMGISIGDLGGGLDSTRSGIFYLSETVSKIFVQKTPSNFKEKITASKVSGQDNGFSFNNAQDVNFNFYENTVKFGDSKVISPIASYALSHYNYKLSGTFYSKNGNLINKIALLPKRKGDNAFNGFLYIVEDDWTIYGLDVNITGEQLGVPFVDKLQLIQNYNYDPNQKSWVVTTQTIDFSAGMLGLKFSGKFSSAYSDYDFTPKFNQNTFGKEILSFEENASKKDTSYWKKLRPVPLTQEEIQDYTFKDSIKVIRKSKKYLDSVDVQRNKLSIFSPLFGYSYHNSYKKWRIGITAPLGNLNFNTVQGWNTNLGINYSKRLNDTGKILRIGTILDYGFSDNRFRPSANLFFKWDNINSPIINISGGVQTAQFNAKKPISEMINTISSIFFERNYMKIYQKSFANISFSSNVTTGVRLFSSLEFAKRDPLVNTTNYSAYNSNDVSYTSNDPRAPLNYTPSFDAHQIWTFSLGTSIRFGSKYISFPNRKFEIPSSLYPSLYVGYKKTFGSNNTQNHSDVLFAQLQQHISLDNFGAFRYRIKAGAFFKVKNIPFMDYAHFNGNRIPISLNSNQLDRFNLLDYYTFSTNDRYANLHAEHNFNGFMLTKIPLINKLGFHFIAGGKALFTPSKKPYTEMSFGLGNVGWGKWRIIRFDYIISNGGINQKKSGFMFGLSF